MLMRHAIYCYDQLLYSRAIHAGMYMYCTFRKQMVVIWTKNILYKAKAVLLNNLYTWLFADFCDPFSYYSWTKTAALVVWQFSVSEEKSSSWDVLFPVFAQLFGRNMSETLSSCVKSATNMIPTVFQFRICSSGFSLVCAFSIVLLISI